MSIKAQDAVEITLNYGEYAAQGLLPLKQTEDKKDTFSVVISDPIIIYLTLLYTQIKCIENIITSVLLYLDLI